jgi:hypothetical protein
MPILFNGNGLNPDTLKPAFRERGDPYVKAIVEAIKDEPGLLMWDIMNEPFTNDYHDRASAEEKKQREAEITAFDQLGLRCECPIRRSRRARILRPRRLKAALGRCCWRWACSQGIAELLGPLLRPRAQPTNIFRT